MPGLVSLRQDFDEAEKQPRQTKQRMLGLDLGQYYFVVTVLQG